MLRDIFTFFSGTYRIRVKSGDKLCAVNLMYEHGAVCNHAKTLSDGDYSFVVTTLTYRRIKILFDSNSIEYSVSQIRGFPRMVKFLLKRPGICVGILFFIMFMWFSSRTVWTFNITGNSTVPDDEILILLDELGCGYGDYIPAIDFDLLHARFIAESENISWIAVNMKGNHANVEVLEIKPSGCEKREEGVYASLTAAEDGQVMLVKTTAGVSSVAPGDIVKKGELLVSGVVHVREDRIRYEYAEGEVLAYVPRVIEVKIPFENSEKVYTGNTTDQKSIKILKKSINLFSKGGIEYTTYDKIIESKQLSLFGLFPLPVWSEKVTYKEYEYMNLTNGYEKTVATAMAELRIRLDEILEDSELVSNKVTAKITEDAFVIRYDMICLTDIAVKSEFTVEEIEYPAVENPPD